jgi:hypothetical protein
MIPAIEAANRVALQTSDRERCCLHHQQMVTDHVLATFLEAEILRTLASYVGPWRLMPLQDRQIWDQLPELRSFAGMTGPPFTTILVCEDEELDNSEDTLEQDPDEILRDVLCEIGYLGLQATCIRLDSVEAQEFRHVLDIPRHVVPTAMIVVGQAAECNELIDQLCEIRPHSRQD